MGADPIAVLVITAVALKEGRDAWQARAAAPRPPSPPQSRGTPPRDRWVRLQAGLRLLPVKTSARIDLD
ncbi:hypothetical protein [Streptomyces flaveus]|uniref:hypothetical protein n=1 Tax=Streptomyces flaveus TaxID=66370 RepID=UPI00331651D6